MSEPILTKASATAAYGGGVTAFLGGLTVNEIAAYGGLIVGVVGLISNIIISVYFKAQHLKLAREKTGDECGREIE